MAHKLMDKSGVASLEKANMKRVETYKRLGIIQKKIPFQNSDDVNPGTALVFIKACL